nr:MULTISPECIES: trehalose-phosphatase [Microbacterium]
MAAIARTPRLLVALDFDGTLSPLVDEPMTARMAPEARTAVAALLATPATSVSFVSGRTLEHLRVIAEHDDTSAVLLAGSHGAEYWTPRSVRAPKTTGTADADALALRDALRAEAESAIADIEGAWVEAKEFGFGVHSRLVDPAQADQVHGRVDRLVAARAPGWRRRVGHNITEFSFRAEGKDTAVRLLREATEATGVLFAGDDVTDEDAIAALGPEDVGVKVGAGPTAAQIRVDDIAGLAALLLSLAHLRDADRE